MHNVVGVRFQEAGKIYYFSPAGFEDIEVGEYVVVETSRGLEVCRVIIAPGQVVNAELSETLKPIKRLAYPEDLERMYMLKARAEEDVSRARVVVNRFGLPLKVSSATYNLDGTRLTLYFTVAEDGRIDLRDLVRELQSDLDCQVQLRQVGPRDQAKAVGGYGICGRRLCCTSWLTAFPAISIKMAKEQNQPLNPNKISGQCGRLLCCLSYENDMYRQLKAELPRAGTLVSTPAGDARVVGVNALRQVVALQMADFKVVEMPAAALSMERGVVRVIALPDEPADAAAIETAEPVPLPPERPRDRERPERRPRPQPPVIGVEGIERRRPSDIAADPGMEASPQAARRRRRRRRGGPRDAGPDSG
jgi:cell fate regulator YaaT (PSP1 superfamily)